MGRPKPIEWPDKAKICVTFIVPWEVWPENFATHESLQRHGGATLPPPKAVFKQNMALVTEREYGDRVGIWRVVDLFDRHNLKVTFLMNGLKVEQFADECREFKAKAMNSRPKVTNMNILSCTPKSRSARLSKRRWRLLKRSWGKNPAGISPLVTLLHPTLWNWLPRQASFGGRTL